MPTEDGIRNLAKLSPRERQVLSMVCDGFLYKDISAKLYISIPTVKTDMVRVYVKLGLKYYDKAGRIREIHQVYCPLLKDSIVSPEPMPPEPVPSETNEPVPMEIMKMVDEDELAVIPPKRTEVIYIPQQTGTTPPIHRTPWLIIVIFAGVILGAGIILGRHFAPGSIPAQANPPVVVPTQGPVSVNNAIPSPNSPQVLPTDTPIQQAPVVATNPPQPTAPIIPTSTVPSITLPFLIILAVGLIQPGRS